MIILIVTLLSWSYIFIVCFSCGLLVSAVLGKVFSCRIEDPDAVCCAGICFATVAAEAWSIFGSVGLILNLVLVILSAASAFLYREKIREYLFMVKGNKGFIIRTAVIAIVIAAFASDIPSDYDTYLYHAQSIAWIERFGLVKGLANLHNRFGYNSAFMCLQALFSFGFAGRSLHQMNGFLCFFMSVFVCEKGLSRKGKEFSVPDLINLSAVFYIVFMLKSISSSGSDMMTMLLLLYLFEKWTELSEKGIRNSAMYGYLAILAFFLGTVKLSAAPVSLLAIYPIYLLIKEKRTGDLIRFIVFGAVIFLPFLARNVLISGYLLYPMESIDIFNVDWKVPLGVVRTDRLDITAFGRTTNGIDGPLSLTGWIQIWFRNLEFIPRLLFCVSIAAMIRFVIVLINYILKRQMYEKRGLFISLVMAVTFLYWFLGAPSMRFGIVISLLFTVLIFGLYSGREGKRAITVFLCVCTLWLFFSYTGEYSGRSINLVYPEDYSSFECSEVVLENNGTKVTIYKPVEGDRAGMDVFPATPEINPDYTELRGTDIKDGFRAIKH